jgi:cysteine-rich repeat protein
MRAWTRATRWALAAPGLSLLLAVPALAHGGRLPFDAWGGFSGDVLRCQRVIAQAAAQCAANAWAARRACREAALAGGTCDEPATAARIASARRTAQDEIDAACTERQATAVGFLSLSFDLQQDMISFCREWVTAAESAAFGTLGSSSCAKATAAAITGVMHSTLRNRRRCMDRIAARPGGDPGRPSLLQSADRRLRRAVDQAARRLSERCPEFASLYGRAPADLLATLAARADCVGGSFYIQDRVLCAPPVCGNGVIEPNEACDDGNTADGDACPASCVP